MASVNGVSIIIDGTVAYASGKVGVYHAQGILGNNNKSIIWSIDNPNSRIHFENADEGTSDHWGAVTSQVSQESLLLTLDDGRIYPLSLTRDKDNNIAVVGGLSMDLDDFDNHDEITQWFNTVIGLLTDLDLD